MKKILCGILALLMTVSLFTVAVSAQDKVLNSGNITDKSAAGVSVNAGGMFNWSYGGYVCFGDVDLTGIKSVRLKVLLDYLFSDNGETFRIYIDNPLSGKCIGYVTVNDKSDEPVYYGGNIAEVSGTHKLYLKHNYSHTTRMNVQEVVLSTEKWVGPHSVTPVPDDKIVDNYHDTWTAVDAVGRKLADYEETGDIKAGDHDICMFYWNWHIHDSVAKTATEVLKEDPAAYNDYYNKAWPQNGPIFWDEPVYGYYTAYDYWHVRKTAELMSNAGVDAVFMDYTNGDSCYSKTLNLLLQAYHDAREDGVEVPKVSAYMQMGATGQNKLNSLKSVYFNLFYNEDYKDLWYYMDGKPFIIQAYANEARAAVDPKDIEEMALFDKIMNFFTIRGTGSRAAGPATPDEANWLWLENYPQYEWGVTDDGRTECVGLGMAINESYVDKGSKVGVFSDPYTKGKSYTEAFGEDYFDGAVHQGYFMKEQASRVLDIDPSHVFVDGWNEWNTARGLNYSGFNNACVDLFDSEGSRDFEPTKGILKDDYYNLLVDFSRKYKGTRPAPVASAEKTVDILGAASQWDDVKPEFINDYSGYERNAEGYRNPETGERYLYKTTVINSISRAKAARDSENLYFYVKCDKDIKEGGKGFMNLYINTDRNRATGWEGYDYAVNLDGAGVVSKFTGTDWTHETVGKAEYKVSGNVIQLALSRALIGETGMTELEFKVTDGIEPNGNLMLFYSEGVSAPIGRFNYLYTEKEQTALTTQQREALSDTTVLKAGSQKMIVKGAKMNVYDADIRVSAFEENNTLYIPTTAVEELMGYGISKINYDYTKNMIFIKTHDLEGRKITNYQWIYTTLDTREVRIDGKYATTTNPVIARNGIVYVPATILSECFGWNVAQLGNGAYALSKHTADTTTSAAVISHLQ